MHTSCAPPSALVTVALLQRADTISPPLSLGGTAAGSLGTSFLSSVTAFPSSGLSPDPVVVMLVSQVH